MTTEPHPVASTPSLDTLELIAGPWDQDGRCRSSQDGVEYRVTGAIPGESLRVKVVGRSRGAPVAWAEVEEVLEQAPDGPARREPPCPLHGRCGACGLQHADEPNRMRARVDSARPLLPEDLLGALAPRDEWVRSPAAFGYRHKAILLPFRPRDGSPEVLRLGGFARGTHDVVDLADCRVLAPSLLEAERIIREQLEPAIGKGTLVATPPGSPVPKKASALRAVVLRSNREGDVLATFIAIGRKAVRIIRPLAARIAKGDGPIVGTFLQEHDGRGDAVTNRRRPRLLAGAKTITEVIDGQPLTLSPLGFFQVNPDVLELLVQRAAAALEPGPIASVVDLYCGGGVLGLALARRAGCPLLGVDVGVESIHLARRDAAAWGVDATFLAGTPDETLSEDNLAAAFGDTPAGRRVVVLDPPRSGCRPADLAAALRLQPDVVVYLSCSAASQGKDAAALTEAGWVPRVLIPADMLPQTPHLEWLAIWDRA